MRVAIPTTGKRKLSNKVADTFSDAEEFTIVKITDNQTETKLIDNPGKDQKRGAGPLAANTLRHNHVELVLTSELGPGVMEILQEYGIEFKIVESGLSVKETLMSLDLLNARSCEDSPQ